MNSSRRAAAAAVSISLALGGVAVAHADDSTVLYVDGSSTSCTDSGVGAITAPYCTIQAAADAAVAGDTVEIAAGTYTGQVDIKSVGTAEAPIDFETVGGNVSIYDGTGQTGPSLNFDGASHVNFAGTFNSLQFNARGVQVNNSADVTFNGLYSLASPTETDAFHITGTSTNVALTRSEVGNVLIDGSGSGDVISTNYIEGLGALSGIVISGTSNVDVTSNTVLYVSSARNAISLSADSTGASIENNIVAYPGTSSSPSVPAVAVDASSTTGTTLDYNVVYPQSSSGNVTQSAYSWGGSAYASASALNTATGQGAHDLNTDPLINGLALANRPSAPQINSANSAAPGMLSTDLYGTSCSIDPLVAVTGTGSPAYCERGALQPTYSTTDVAQAGATDALSVSLDSSLAQTTMGHIVSQRVIVGAVPAVSYTIAWGDGQTQTVQASATTATTVTTHTYAEVGTYTITETAHLPSGTVSSTTSVTTAGSDYTPYGPSRILDTRKGIGTTKAAVPTGGSIKVKVAGVGSIPANVTAVALNLTAVDTSANGYLDAVADGEGLTGSNLNYLKGQTVANSAIVPVAADGYIDIYNEGNNGGTADVIADVSGYFTRTAASGYTPVTEDRILDTRKGTGLAKARIAAGADVPVTIAGVDSIPSGVTAVAVHVTVTDTTGNGWIAAEANGAGTPTTSSLNYLSGQTISNTVIVPVGADGEIELYNGGESGSVDLIADVAGYFSTDGADAYMPVTPYRAWDSRADGFRLTPGGTNWYSLSESGAYAFPANATMITNLTVTDTTANGFITAYPYGTTQPGVSNLNYLKGQTVAGLSLLGTATSVQSIDVYNNSTGSADLILDVFGYFANS